VLPDRRAFGPSLDSALRAPDDQTIYVLAILRPVATVDADALVRATVRLTGRPLPTARYVVAVGRAGSPPTLVQGSERPFRASTRLDGLKLDIRIESWLPFDTMRRAGFGHVIVNGRHAVTIERGVTFATLDNHGRPGPVYYAGGAFAPVPRFVISARPE
jgi:hypothetical protein